jgi:hypothetical protein
MKSIQELFDSIAEQPAAKQERQPVFTPADLADTIPEEVDIIARYNALQQRKRALKCGIEEVTYQHFDMYANLNLFGRAAINFVLYGEDQTLKNCLGENKYRLNAFGRRMMNLAMKYCDTQSQTITKKAREDGYFCGEFKKDAALYASIFDYVERSVYADILKNREVAMIILREIDEEFPKSFATC